MNLDTYNFFKLLVYKQNLDQRTCIKNQIYKVLARKIPNTKLKENSTKPGYHNQPLIVKSLYNFFMQLKLCDIYTSKTFKGKLVGFVDN